LPTEVEELVELTEVEIRSGEQLLAFRYSAASPVAAPAP
jgi:hypothetical protein